MWSSSRAAKRSSPASPVGRPPGGALRNAPPAAGGQPVVAVASARAVGSRTAAKSIRAAGPLEEIHGGAATQDVAARIAAGSVGAHRRVEPVVPRPRGRGPEHHP